jgi:wobble nucleotide-excising tRNase
VNLVDNLNGTGERNSPFSKCSIDGSNHENIRVYNQKFIQDYFYEPDNLKGIFTLSKENKEAKEKIKSAEKEMLFAGWMFLVLLGCLIFAGE